MELISVHGGKQLSGSVTISGAKNAAVAVLPAVVLSDGLCRIENLPDISDVSNILKVLKELGASVKLINKSTVNSSLNSDIKLSILYKFVVSSKYSFGNNGSCECLKMISVMEGEGCTITL